MTELGIVKSIFRYPVKSMRGESCKRAYVNYSGIAGDRVFAFVDPGAKASFPWFTAREYSELLLYKPKFQDEFDPDGFPKPEQYAVEITTPSGNKFKIDAPELAEELKEKSGIEAYLRFSERGMPDARPLSIMGESSVKQMGQDMSLVLDPLRFRANFYVAWHDSKPHFEDELIGKTLKIGNKVQIQISKKDPRCKIVGLDPTNAENNPEVLTSIAKSRKGCLGVYAVTLREGWVEAGDKITLVH